MLIRQADGGRVSSAGSVASAKAQQPEGRGSSRRTGRTETGSRIAREPGSRVLRGETSEGWGLFLEIIRSGLWIHVTKVHVGVRHWECVRQKVVKLRSRLDDPWGR